MASCAASSRRSAPVAATSAMAIAIAVSSVHSPGSHGAAADHRDVEFRAAGGLELVRRAERVAGRGAQQHALDAVFS